MTFLFLKVLLGTGHFGVFGAWWDKDGGRNGLGSLSFRRFTIVVISFPFRHVAIVAPTFSLFERLYRCDCYIYIA
jgi:hypothetical protein